MGATSRTKGHVAEREVARWMREHGFPNAQRAVRAGFSNGRESMPDPGDIAGVPAIVSVKNCKTHYIDAWMRELDGMRADDLVAFGVLVVKRAGRADPADWWAWLTLPHFAALLGADAPDTGSPVCIDLRTFCALLVAWQGAGSVAA